MIIEIGNDTELEKAINSNNVVFVDFYANWCIPCKVLNPILETIAAEFEGKVLFVKFDIENSEQLAMSHGIAAIPTILIFKGGWVADRIVGLQSENHFRDALNKVLQG